MIERDKLVVGETYLIDVGYNNSGEVILMKVYGHHFCKVKDPDTGEEWDTMIYRLSDHKPKNQIEK